MLLGVLIVYMAWRRGAVLGKFFCYFHGGQPGGGVDGVVG